MQALFELFFTFFFFPSLFFSLSLFLGAAFFSFFWFLHLFAFNSFSFFTQKSVAKIIVNKNINQRQKKAKRCKNQKKEKRLHLKKRREKNKEGKKRKRKKEFRSACILLSPCAELYCIVCLNQVQDEFRPVTQTSLGLLFNLAISKLNYCYSLLLYCACPSSTFF